MTALDTIQSDNGQSWAFVLALEGFEHLVTSHNTDEAVTAWSGTGWTKAIPGLDWKTLQFQQKITPWDPSIQAPSFRIRIQGNEGDVLGKALFKFPSGARTELTQSITPTTGSLTIHAKDTSDFDASGVIYIGPERFEYSSKDATHFFVDAGDSGTLSPFSSNEAADWHFPRPHRVTTDHQAARPVEITQEPSDWVGKHVGLFIHHRNGGTWSTADDAHLQFAGRILGYEDDANGSTWLEVEDIRGQVRDAVLHKDQWRATIPEGITLEAGDFYYFWERGTLLAGSVADGYEASSFFSGITIDVVSTVSDDATEIEAGRYTASEICSALNRCLHKQRVAGDIDGTHWFMVGQHGAEGTRVRWNFGLTDMHKATIVLGASRKEMIGFLGFATEIIRGTNKSGGAWEIAKEVEDTAATIHAENAPMRRLMPWTVGVGRQFELPYENEEGSWVDQSSWLPTELLRRKRSGDSDDELGIVRIGERNLAFCARKSGSDELEVIFTSDNIGPIVRGAPPKRDQGDTEDDEGELVVRQILVLEGELQDLLTSLIASQTGDGANHATHDSLPWGAGVPFSLLGDFVDSVSSAEEESDSGALTVVLEKPTKLLTVLAPDLLLRYSWLIWKDEGLRMVSPPRPSPLTADFTLTHANKAAPAGDTAENHATPSMVTSDHLRNVIKIRYNRSIVEDDYQSELHILDQPSIDRWGEEPVTIDARNLYGDFSSTAEAVDNMAAALASRMVPTYAHPMRKIVRTANVNFWGAAPGDTVSVTDPYARNPVSGERSISVKAGVILGVTEIVDEGRVELEILFADEDRRLLAGASANVASYTSGDPSITIEQGDFTNTLMALFSSDRDIDAFAASDAITIHERGPSDTASVQSWDRDITSLDRANNKIHLSATLSGFDSSKSYRVVPQYHSSVQSSQKLQSYMADDVDGLIEDAARANAYTADFVLGFSELDATRPYESLPDFYVADGAPVSTALSMSLADCVNNLASYKCAANMPIMFDGGFAVPLTGVAPQAVATIPLFVGAGDFAPFSRSLFVAPLFRSITSGNTCQYTVICSKLPPHDDQGTLTGPQESVSFSTTSDSFVAPDAKELPLVFDKSRGLCWLTIIWDGSERGAIEGLIENRLGPIG